VNAGPNGALLLAAAHSHLDASASVRLATLAAATRDWDRVRAAAGLHGVMPPLARALETWAHDAVPPEVLQRLHDEALASGHRSLRLAGDLVTIIDRLGSAGIPVLAFKGPTLAVLAYGDLGLRPCRDLDLLVHGRSLPAAERLVSALGYQAAPSPFGLLTGLNQRTYTRNDGEIVELHWAMAPAEFPSPLDEDGLWARPEPVQLGTHTVYTLGVEDLALFLCAHGAKHLWERLSWVCDIAALLARRPDLDWDAVLTSARQRGAERMVLLALHLADDLLGAPVPEAAHERLRGDPAVRALGERVRIRMFAGPHPPTVWERRAFYWRVRERWHDRLRDFARALFTPTEPDWQVVRFPDSLFTLYYLIRPLRLAVKYGSRLLRSPAR